MPLDMVIFIKDSLNLALYDITFHEYVTDFRNFCLKYCMNDISDKKVWCNMLISSSLSKQTNDGDTVSLKKIIRTHIL